MRMTWWITTLLVPATMPATSNRSASVVPAPMVRPWNTKSCGAATTSWESITSSSGVPSASANMESAPPHARRIPTDESMGGSPSDRPTEAHMIE